MVAGLRIVEREIMSKWIEAMMNETPVRTIGENRRFPEHIGRIVKVETPPLHARSYYADDLLITVRWQKDPPYYEDAVMTEREIEVITAEKKA